MNHWYPRLCRSTKMRCSRNTLCSVQLVDDYTMSLSSSTHPLDHLDPPIPSGPPTSTVNPNQSSSTSRPTISLRSDASATRSRSTWTLTGISQPTGRSSQQLSGSEGTRPTNRANRSASHND
ncbi:hypothetical protein L226DRAFT_214336 [Lentinus tigrinus ALCF2SS1-7]|uniref:uncharacterized protein n=1 Tax=Lentinus tigrinus ALCF2SS1-7 TaxID=1328758 RepID=UPI0011663E27|nr:hypothetical protein L226DRAFT_214336 [Lentinus tigrinus ALCF2SS1-7]